MPLIIILVVGVFLTWFVCHAINNQSWPPDDPIDYPIDGKTFTTGSEVRCESTKNQRRSTDPETRFWDKFSFAFLSFGNFSSTHLGPRTINLGTVISAYRQNGFQKHYLICVILPFFVKTKQFLKNLPVVLRKTIKILVKQNIIFGKGPKFVSKCNQFGRKKTFEAAQKNWSHKILCTVNAPTAR